MMFRNLRYYLVQGFKGVVSNSLMSIVSIGIVIACLILFGLSTLFGMNVNYIGEQIKQQCQINVYMVRDIDRDGMRHIASELEDIEGIKSIELWTKEERFEKTKENYDEADAIDILEADNPLRDAYILTLDDLNLAENIAEKAAEIDGVDEVKNRQDIIDYIEKITGYIRNFSIWTLVILIVIAMFIISNTIKLGLFARRKEINIMKFVGATNWFIRWPFIIEGAILGLIGAAGASAIVILLYNSVINSVIQAMNMFNGISFVSVSYAAQIIIISFMLLGIGIGTVGSIFSIRKYLQV